MQLNSLSTVGIATQVWVQAARTLTTTPTVRAGVVAVNTSVAATSLLDLRPAANTTRLLNLYPSAANFQWGSYDGTTFTVINNSLAATTAFWTAIGPGLLGQAIKNNTAGALNFTYIGTDNT